MTDAIHDQDVAKLFHFLGEVYEDGDSMYLKITRNKTDAAGGGIAIAIVTFGQERDSPPHEFQAEGPTASAAMGALIEKVHAQIAKEVGEEEDIARARRAALNKWNAL